MKTPTKATPSTPAPDAIGYRANLIWEKEGQPHGRDTEFWLRAEKELQAEMQSDPPALAQPGLPPVKPKARLATARSAAGASPASKTMKPASASRRSL